MGARRSYGGGKFNTLLRLKNVRFYLGLEGAGSVQRCAWDSDITYSHAMLLLGEWERMALVTKELRGRTSHYTYSMRGKKVRDALMLLKDVEVVLG